MKKFLVAIVLTLAFTTTANAGAIRATAKTSGKVVASDFKVVKCVGQTIYGVTVCPAYKATKWLAKKIW